MNARTFNLGANIIQLRAKMGLTQERLSAKCGVSRSMLSKIERNEVSPTIIIVSKIAGGLSTSISELLGENVDNSRVHLKRRADRVCTYDPASGSQRYLIMNTPRLGLELKHTIIPPGKFLGTYPPHKPGTIEYLLLEQGKLSVTLDKREVYHLEAGDCLAFSADVSHEYKNEAMEECHFYLVQVIPPGI